MERPESADALAALLIGDGGQGVVGLTAVHGGGGFGKTTLARMVCDRSDVQDRFPDGMMWVDAGQDLTGAALAERINGLSERLCGLRPALSDPMQAGMRLGELLGERRILLIVDDVWTDSQLRPFLQGGPSCRRLLTTRNRQILPGDGCPVLAVDVMDSRQAEQILRQAVPGLPDAAGLARRCGYWPVLLGLVAGQLRSQVGGGVPVADAVADVEWGLADAGPVAFDDEGRRHRAVAATVDASLRLLTDIDRAEGGDVARYLELAVFPEDTIVPRTVLEVLWAHTAGWNRWQTRRFCQRLADLALVHAVPHQPPGLRLHDVVRRYLQVRVGGDPAGLHTRLLEAYRARLPVEDGNTCWWRLPATEGYMWRALAGHLHASGAREELANLARDLRWAAKKIHIVGSGGVGADLQLLARDEHAVALAQLVRQTEHLYRPGDAPSTVAATFAAYAAGVPALARHAADLRRYLKTPYVTPTFAPLPDQPDPALLRTLAGHTGGVKQLVLAPDGSWLASSGDDGKVRVWDPHSGAQLAVLPVCLDSGSKEHTGHVGMVAVAPDGSWLACGGRESGVSTGRDHQVDCSVRVWEPRTGALLAVLTGHTSPADVLAVAPDGSWLASACSDFHRRDCSVRVWDTGTWAELAVLTGHAGPVDVLAVAPDGSWLAAAGNWMHGSVPVWDPRTGVQRAVLTGHIGGITLLAVAPDGSWLASAGGHTVRSSGGECVVRVWDPRTWVQRAVLAGHTERVTVLAVAPDGSWLASGDGHGTVRVWDPRSGRQRAVLTGHTRDVTALAIAPDGSWLASGDGHGTVRVWDPHSGRQRAVLTGRTVLAVAPDGSWLASANDDHTVRVWDPHSGRQRAVLAGHTADVTVLAVASGGSWLASAAKWSDYTVRVWDPRARPQPAPTRTGERALAAAPDGSWLACADEHGTVQVLEPRTRARRAVFAGQAHSMTKFVVSPDGSWLAAAARDQNAVRAWNIRTGKQWTLEVGSGRYMLELAPAPDGSWLACASDDATIRIWDPRKGRLHATLRSPTTRVGALVVAPDGSWLASASRDPSGLPNRTESRFADMVRVWDLHTGRQRAELGFGVRVLAVAPDGSWLAGGSQDGTVQVWDPRTGGRLAKLTGHTDRVHVLAVAPDGSWLASAGGEFSHPTGAGCSVRLWDTRTWGERAVLSGHTEYVALLAAGADGSWIASASGGWKDCSVRVWDTRSGATRAVLTHSRHVSVLAVAPDGSRLATADQDGLLRIWDPVDVGQMASLRVDGHLMNCLWIPGCGQIVFDGTRGLYQLDLVSP